MIKKHFSNTAVALALSQLLGSGWLHAQTLPDGDSGVPPETLGVPATSKFSTGGAAPEPAAVPAQPDNFSGVAPESVDNAPASSTTSLTQALVAGTAPASTQPQIIRGTDVVVAPPRLQNDFAGEPMSFRLEEAPVVDVIHMLMRDLLKADYVIHQPVTGNVTLATQKTVTPDQAVLLLESALQANGLQIVRDPRGTYHIGKPDALKTIVPAMRQVLPGKSLPAGTGAIIVPLQYIGAGEMAAILRPMVPPEAVIRVDSIRNLLVLAGTRTQAEGWLDIINTFDVNLLKGMSVGVFPLKNISTKDVEAALRLLTGATGTGTAASGATPTPTPAAPAGTARPGTPAPNASGAQQGAGAPGSALPESFPLYGAVRIMPIERINSVLVVTPKAQYLDEARSWIEKLDQPGMNSDEPQLFVYPVQNGNARHLTQVMQGLFGGGGPGSSGATGIAPGLSTGVAQSGLLGGGFNNSNPFGSSNTNRPFGSGGGGFGAGSTFGAGNSMGAANRTQQAPGVSGVNLGQGGPRMVADELNNAILIYGTRGEYAKIEMTLKRLDLPPTQVLIEASIIEVSLGDDLQYGLQWAFNGGATIDGQWYPGSGALGALPLTKPDPTKPSPFASGSGGFTYTLRNLLGGDLRAVLNLLASKSMLNVISSPTLMVQDNFPAAIMVGTQQPIRTGELSTATGGINPSTSTTYQYKDVGVNLQVTPSVNAGNMVTMDIMQSISNVTDPGNLQPIIDTRQLSSKVAVRSGETLVLGGLIKDNTVSGKKGLPILGDLPLIGSLFSSTGRSTQRTELMVIITPRVVRSDQEVRDVSIEFKNRMQGFIGFESSEALRRAGMVGTKAVNSDSTFGSTAPAAAPK